MTRPPYICAVYWRDEFLGWVDSHIAGIIDLKEKVSRQAALMTAKRMNARQTLNDGKDSHAERQES